MRLTSGDGALRVLLQLARASDAGEPYGFRFEPQDYILPTAGGATPSARFDWTQEVLADLEAVRRPGRNPAVIQRLGERLRTFIQAAGWAEWEREIAQALAAQRPVFLTIRSSAAELYALPWELLTLKSGQFIGEVDGLLLRFEWPESESLPEQPKPRPEGGRILLAWSAAAGAVPASEHIGAIARACAAGFHPFDASSDVLAHASLSRITQALESAERLGSPVAVLHLLCHGTRAGDTFGLALDGEQGQVVVDAAQLRQQLAPFARQVRLVVLSACDSGNLGDLGNRLGSLAQALHRCGFQSVIASRFPLSVRGSVAMAETFYQELLSGPSSLETALLASRKRLARMETDLPAERRMLDWASVQLYARHADGDDTRPVVFRPFRGLLAFQPEHRRFFFGRDREIAEVLTDLQALVDRQQPRFLVIAGASGTGKSSLVFAGAVPRLLAAHPGLTFLKMRPGSSPSTTLDDALSRRADQAPALLVVDQLEEIFTQTAAPADREAFVRRLWSLAGSTESGLRIVITLRVDFIGRCGELVVDDAGLRLDRVVYDEAHRVFVAQLGLEELRAAVENPAHRAGLELQAGLADRIVHEVGAEPGALPLLEDALDVLWQQRRDRTLTQSAYEAMGGVVGALQKRADALLAQLSKSDQALAQRVLLSLVAVADDTALDSRLRVPVAELRQSVAAVDAPGFERVLRELVEARLLVLSDDEQSPTMEVAHEALIRKWPRLRAWLDEDRAGLVVQRRVKQAAQLWDKQRRDESLLFRGAQLAQAMEWRKTWESRLGDLERSFLSASQALKRKQNQGVAILAVALVAMIGLVILGVWQRRQVAAESARAEQASERAATATEAAGESVRSAQQSERAKESERLATQAAQRNRPLSTLVAAMKVAAPELGSSAAELRSESWAGLLAALRHLPPSRAFRGHAGSVWSAAVSPDGTRVATAGTDRQVKLWRAQTGQPLATFSGHADFVRSVDFSPDGSLLVSAGEDGAAMVWDARPGSNRLLPLLTLRGHTDAVWQASFSPDGTQIVTAGWDRSARLWSARTGQPELVFRGHQGPLSTARFSPDGARIITASWDALVRIFGARDRTGRALVTLRGHTAPVRDAAFSPDGARVISASDDGTVRLWDARLGQALLTLQDDAGPVYSAAFSTDGTRIITAGRDGAARLWDARTGRSILTLQGHAGAITAARLSVDGQQAVTASQDGTARLWSVNAAEGVSLFEGRNPQLSPDGHRILTSVEGEGQSSAVLWDVETGRRLLSLAGEDARLSPDGARIATTLTGQEVVVLWDATTGKRLVSLEGHAGQFAAGGARVLTLGTSRPATLWDAQTGQALWNPGAGDVEVRLSPGGDRLLTLRPHEAAKLWDTLALSRVIAKAPVPLAVIQGYDARFSTDGSHIIATGDDRRLQLWSAEKGQLVRSLDPGEQGPLATQLGEAVLSPDRQRLLLRTDERLLGLWNLETGALVAANLEGRDATFSRTGARIFTAADSGGIRLWDGRTGQPLLSFDGAGSFVSADFSLDESRVVTGYEDGTVQVWQIPERPGSRALPPQLAFHEHRHSVTSLRVSRDGQRILSASEAPPRKRALSGTAERSAEKSAERDQVVVYLVGNSAYYERGCEVLSTFVVPGREVPSLPKLADSMAALCPRAATVNANPTDQTAAPTRPDWMAALLTGKAADKDAPPRSRQEADALIDKLSATLFATDAEDPELPNLLFRLSSLYAEQLRAADATLRQRWLAEAIDKHQAIVASPKLDHYPRLDEPLFYLAYLLSEAGRGEQARGVLQRLIGGFPRSSYLAPAYLWLGELHFARGELQSAQRFYEKVLEYPSSGVDRLARFQLGWIFYQINDFGRAMESFVETLAAAEQAQDADAKLAKETKKAIARVYSQLGSAAKAWPFFQKHGKDYAPTMLEQLAEIYNSQGKFSESVQTYRQLIDLAVKKKAIKERDHLCYWQTEILKNTLSMTGSRAVPETVKEMQRLSAVYEQLRERGELPKNLLDECRDSTAGMLRELATVWHKEAMKTGVRDTYANASDLYKEYIRRFPKEKDSYLMHYWYAELLFKLGSIEDTPAGHWYCDAAQIYTDVVKMDPKGQKLKDAAYALVIAWKNCLGLTDEAESQPDAASPRPIPEKQQKLLAALDTYVQYVSDAPELPTIKYRRARLYYSYAHLDKAIPLFRDLVENHTRSELALFSANLLLDSLTRRGDEKQLAAQTERMLALQQAGELKDPVLAQCLAFIQHRLRTDADKPEHAPITAAQLDELREKLSPRPRPRAEGPEVIPGTAEARGGLDRELIRRIVRRHINEIKYCFELEGNSWDAKDQPARAAESHPAHPPRRARREPCGVLDRCGPPYDFDDDVVEVDVGFTRFPQGDIRSVIGFEILPSGSLSSVEVQGLAHNPALHRCLVSRVKQWIFPRSNGEPVAITYPVVARMAADGDVLAQKPYKVIIWNPQSPRLEF